MTTIVYVDDDFRRMPRADMAKLQKLVAEGRYGKHKISYKDRQLNIEIKKQGDKIQVQIVRVS